MKSFKARENLPSFFYCDFSGDFSLIDTGWFQGSAGSALEPTDLQAPRLRLLNRQAYVLQVDFKLHAPIFF